MSSLVSLYAIQRETGAHRDRLERACYLYGIDLYLVRVSTPRYRVRKVRPADADRLRRIARGRSPAARSRASGGSPASIAGCSTPAPG